MPSTIHKLDALLNKYGMVINKIYHVNGLCKLAEVILADSTVVCIMEIPDTFKIKVDMDATTVHLYPLTVTDTGDIIGKYSRADSVKNNALSYGGVAVDSDMVNTSTAEQTIEEGYNSIVTLDTQSHNKDVYRQIKRLSNCMKGNPSFGVCMKCDTSIYTSRYSHAINCFSFDDSLNQKFISIHILIDLPRLYKNVKHINRIVKTMTEQIIDVIHQNVTVQMEYISQHIQGGDRIKSIHAKYLTKNKDYIRRIALLETTFGDIIAKETDIIHAHDMTIEKIMNKHLRIPERDLERTKQTAQTTRKLAEVNGDKKEVFKNIMSLDLKNTDLTLKFDRFCFDNSVMLHSVYDNITAVEQIK